MSVYLIMPFVRCQKCHEIFYKDAILINVLKINCGLIPILFARGVCESSGKDFPVISDPRH